MDNIYHNLTSFLAIWFRNLQKSTYNVNVINKEADKVSPLLYEKLQAIHFLLQGLEGKELKVKVSNQKELNTKDLEDKLSALLSGVNSIELDNSTVERLLSDLISLSKGVKKVEVLNQPEMPTKMNVAGKVEVSNLPKVQEVTGDFNLKESKDILNSLKELASEIRDLKLESIQGYKSIGQTFVGSTGSREAHKLTDGTKTATITTSGANNALDVNIVAGGAGNGAILDGVDSDIKATVKDLTNSNPLTVALVDGSGDHITSIGGGTQYTEGDTDATIVGTAIMWEDAGNALTPVSSAKPLPVSASIDDGGGVITVDGTVAVTNSDITSIKTATELIDDAIFVDDADWTADTSKHMLIGGVTQVATTANTDGDVTPLTTNAFRELRTAIPESDLATAATSHVKKYYTNAGAVTDGIIWSPAAGKRWYVTDLIINVSAAATVTLEDDKAGGDEAVMKFELAANSGVSHTFNTPWYSGEDAADLIITTSAGNVYVTVTGYEL